MHISLTLYRHRIAWTKTFHRTQKLKPALDKFVENGGVQLFGVWMRSLISPCVFALLRMKEIVDFEKGTSNMVEDFQATRELLISSHAYFATT